MTKQCKDCNNTFTIEDGEINFYKSKNLHLPNRCKSCRDKRKANNTNNNQVNSNYQNNPNNFPEQPSGNLNDYVNFPNQPSNNLNNYVNFPNQPTGNLNNYVNNYQNINDKKQNASNTRPSNTDKSYKNTNTYSNSNRADTKFKQNLLLIIAFVVFTIASVLSSDLLSPSQSIGSSSQFDQYSQFDQSTQTNSLTFRYEDYLIEHFEKHGSTLGHSTAESYLNGANNVVNSSVALKGTSKK